MLLAAAFGVVGESCPASVEVLEPRVPAGVVEVLSTEQHFTSGELQ